MFNLFKSKEEKRQEQVAAYIDQQMGQAERDRFEALLGQDADLQAELEAQQEVKSLLSQVPQLKAPRNFVLDPAVYGGKAPAPSFIELLYPKLRVATAAASFMFVILLGVGLLGSSVNGTFNSVDGNLSETQSSAEDIAALPVPAEDAESKIAATAPAIAEGVPTPTLLSNPVIEEQQEKIEVAADAIEVEEEVAFEVAADEQPPAEIEVGEADAGAAPESAMMAESDDAMADEDSAAPVSPRQSEPILPEGERVSEAEDTQPAPVETIAPEPTEIALENYSSEGEVAESPEDLSLIEEAPVSDTETPPARTQLSFGAIALWFLGMLSLTLLAATFIVRRKLD